MTETLYPHEILMQYLTDESPVWFALMQIILLVVMITLIITFVGFVSFYMNQNGLDRIPYQDFIVNGLNAATFLLVTNALIGFTSIYERYVMVSA